MLKSASQNSEINSISRSPYVIDIGADRKRTCNFLLVIP